MRAVAQVQTRIATHNIFAARMIGAFVGPHHTAPVGGTLGIAEATAETAEALTIP
jgi:hypothetical protein